MKKLVSGFLWEIWGHSDASLVHVIIFWPGISLVFGKSCETLSLKASFNKTKEGWWKKKRDKVKYKWLILGVNFGSVIIFDFRVELNWVLLANYVRYLSSLLYYCTLIYCYSWTCVCTHCILEPSTDLIVHGSYCQRDSSCSREPNYTLILVMCPQPSAHQIKVAFTNSHLLGEECRRWLSVNLNAH